MCIKSAVNNDINKGEKKEQKVTLLTPTWFEHATFWSGVRRATVAPRSRLRREGRGAELIQRSRSPLFHASFDSNPPLTISVAPLLTARRPPDIAWATASI